MIAIIVFAVAIWLLWMLIADNATGTPQLVEPKPQQVPMVPARKSSRRRK